MCLAPGSVPSIKGWMDRWRERREGRNKNKKGERVEDRNEGEKKS